MKDFLQFDRLITGDIIKYFYWVLAGLAFFGGAISAIVMLVSGDFGSFIVSLLFAIIGPVIIRIYCEMLIVLFKIYETLVEIRNK